MYQARLSTILFEALDAAPSGIVSPASDANGGASRNRMVTIRDVAGESGFSVTTVSMVLNDGPASERISAATSAHVRKVARRLGYRPNLFARSLRSRRSQSLGVIVFDLTDPYCTQILRGIQNHSRSSGLFPIVTDLQDDRSQFQTCLDMLLGRRVEGIIAIANPLYLDRKLLSEFSQRQTPAVVIGRQLAEMLLRRRPGFTGLVAFDDLTACAAIRALTSAGYQVPQDCSVAGFDDIPSAAFYNPPLTTVHQQLEMQGSLGAEIVEELIR